MKPSGSIEELLWDEEAEGISTAFDINDESERGKAGITGYFSAFSVASRVPEETKKNRTILRCNDL